MWRGTSQSFTGPAADEPAAAPPASSQSVPQQPPSRGRKRTRQRVFGLKFAPLRRRDVVEELLKPVVRGMGVRLFATANLDHVVNLRASRQFREAYGMSWLVTADGMPVYLYARLVGADVPERVAGADVMADILQRWSPSAHRLFFLVSSAAAGARIRELLGRRGFSAEQIAVAVPPFGFERHEEFSAALVDSIRLHRPTHLVLGVGAPKSEIWTLQQRDKLGDLYVLAVGASIEFATGLKRRSPAFIGRAGLEWLWRFLSEPKRLFARYFIRSWGFLPAIVCDLKSGGKRISSASK